jgi:Glycosyltransferase
VRILMLTQFFYPPTVGGEERHVADLSSELAARGHDVSVVTLWQKGYPEFEISQGIRIYRVRSTVQRLGMLFSESDRPYAPPFPDPELTRTLRRILLAEHPDIVHAHNWIIHSFTPLKAWSKAKLVVSLHDYSLVCVQKRLMRHEVPCSGPGLTKCLECGTRFYGTFKGIPSTLANFFWGEQERRVVDMFLPVSQAVVEGVQLERHRTPYRIIPNFIPATIETAKADSEVLLSKLPAGDFMLFVGDVTADKGAEVLLRAYAELNTEVPLVLIGRPFIAESDLPANVFLLGRWPHDAVMAAWQHCLFGLVPSIVAETFGIVALEAMFMGKPVIAARSGGLPDVVVDGETGFLVAPGESQPLGQAMQRLLDDPELRQQMGIKARQRAEEFQAKAVVSRFEVVYEELLVVDSAVASPLVESRRG